MAVGDPVEILRLNEDNDPVPYMKLHALKINKTRSGEFSSAGGEQPYAYLTFTFRWNKMLSEIEFDAASFRLVWHGQTLDVIGYDDFKEQHGRVDLHVRSVRSGGYA